LGWDNVDIVSELKSHFPNTHIAIENDANAAAYGEFRATGNGAENFIAITLGTGVGGGIIINNKIYRGLNGSAGELGHIFIVEDGEYCTCGCNGCWEAYASVTALIRQTKEAIAAHPESLMAQDENINGMTSFKAAKAGDKAAQEVVDTYIRHVACGITSLINIFVPDVLVIGGGISKEGDYLLNPIKEYVKKNVFCKVGAQTEIKIATLMNDAGIVGAALASAE
ncbi:MAG: ROK family protein, partial [Alphaproteobacteria bacterium]|nr:ROK family protein [Alphaproteobacteria bacterium]